VFDTVLICNRGEIAVRIIRSCKELGVRTVLAHSTADRDSMAAWLADDTVCLGPGQASRSYNNVPAVLYACAKAAADAVHPGYGFLSEDATFATACEQSGITFVGPSAQHIALMGDKIAARNAMGAAGMPVLPGSDGPLADFEHTRGLADQIGYPVVLKAAAGGGGRGIAIVHCPEDLEDAYTATKSTAAALFSDDRVYLEKFVTDGRHVEVQVLADSYGTALHLGERNCSVQRRQQKLVEESPSPCLDPALRQRLCDAAVAGVRSIGYVSAGTFEFLVDPDDAAYFIEMNTRIQVEHPVTELCSGIDLIEWMLRIACGERLPFTQEDIRLSGHAVEVRINAEDVTRDWVGCSGRISGLVLPGGPRIRVDTHAYPGYLVPPFYDSLLAKVVAFGPSREAALRTLERALAEFRCDGLITNVDFHRRLLRCAEFRNGQYRLDLVQKMFTEPAVSAS
jgi:acetyl-CoA carboxylase biotin carboxylase subunit